MFAGPCTVAQGKTSLGKALQRSHRLRSSPSIAEETMRSWESNLIYSFPK
jgi:hypothetical protein